MHPNLDDTSSPRPQLRQVNALKARHSERSRSKFPGPGANILLMEKRRYLK